MLSTVLNNMLNTSVSFRTAATGGIAANRLSNAGRIRRCVALFLLTLSSVAFTSCAGSAMAQALAKTPEQDHAEAHDQALSPDSSVVDLRLLPTDQLEAFRADERFQYSDEQAPSSSPISDLFWQKWSEFIRNLFGSGIGEPLLWLISISLALFAISRLMGTNPRSVFYKRSRSVSSAIEESDLQRTDFASLIEAALSRGDYREVVRLRFISALKELSDREWIRWTKEKTNRSYVYELRKAPNTSHLAEPFQRIAQWFDYCWYGDLIPDPALYSRIDASFAALERQLSETLGPVVSAGAEAGAATATEALT